MDILELLSLSKNYSIEKSTGGVYEIISNSDLAASIKDGEITFYLTGCYNSGSSWLEIDMDSLTELTKFCNLILKQEGN